MSLPDKSFLVLEPPLLFAGAVKIMNRPMKIFKKKNKTRLQLAL